MWRQIFLEKIYSTGKVVLRSPFQIKEIMILWERLQSTMKIQNSSLTSWGFRIANTLHTSMATTRTGFSAQGVFVPPLGFAQHLQFNQDVFGCAHTSLSTFQFWGDAKLREISSWGCFLSCNTGWSVAKIIKLLREHPSLLTPIHFLTQIITTECYSQI